MENPNVMKYCFEQLSGSYDRHEIDHYDTFLFGYCVGRFGAADAIKHLDFLKTVEQIRKMINMPVAKVHEIYLCVFTNDKPKAEELLKKALVENTGLKVDPKTIDLESQLLALKLMEEEKSKEKQNEEMSLKLAKQIEEEEKMAIAKKRADEEEKLKTPCEICLENIANSDLMPLDACEHIYHPECITKYIKSRIDEKRYPILCPNPKCKKEISMLDMNDFADPDDLDKFTEYSFKYAIETNPQKYSFCPTPDCKYIFMWEKGIDTNDFNCQLCGKRYCLDCRCAYHVGKTCAQYRASLKEGDADAKFIKFVQGMKFKQCPFCRYWVEKTEGCDHMVCRCGREFCYRCGGQYGNCACMRPHPPIIMGHPKPKPIKPIKKVVRRYKR